MRQVIEPRGLTREQAAAYIGVSAPQFMQLVAAQRMPTPKRFGDQLRWDRHEIDRVFDATDAALRNMDAWSSFISAATGTKPSPSEEPTGTSERRVAIPEKTPRQETREAAERRRTIRRSPMQKRDKIALAALYDQREGIRERDLPKGVTFRTEENLLARGYITTTKEQPWGWSLWRLTKRGVEAVERGEAKLE